MNKTRYYVLWGFVILAIVWGVVAWLTESSALKWAATALGLGLISVGLGLNSFLISLHTDKRMTKLDATLARIEGLQEDIRKEQKEQASSGPPIVASLQAMSQYYMDYISKQKGEDKE